jgi:CRP-like cAMP-binding protein
MIGEGELLGEMALVDSVPHSATARAHNKTGCIVIPKRVFEKGLKTSNPIVISVLNTLLRRLRGETGNAAKRTLS